MINRFFPVLFFFVGAYLSAQLGVNTGGAAPDANAAMDLRSRGSQIGALLPRVSTTLSSLPSLATAQQGLMLYSTTDNEYYVWNGSQWAQTPFGAIIASSAPWQVQGGTTAATGNSQNIYHMGNMAVGVNPSSATNALHVKATSSPVKIEGLQAGNGGEKHIGTDANGVVKYMLPASSNFIGYMSTNFGMSGQGSGTNLDITSLTIDTELIDLGSEYDTSSGYFIPKNSGTYFISITLTELGSNGNPYPWKPFLLPGLGSGYVSTRDVAGLAISTNGSLSWVQRFNFETTQDTRSWTFKGVVKLTGGQSYTFAVTGSRDTTFYANNNYANNNTVSGSGIANLFSIKRLE